MHIPPDAFFAALSGSIRLRSLLLLRQFGELCVCGLTQALGEPQPKVSPIAFRSLVMVSLVGLWFGLRLPTVASFRSSLRLL